MRDTRSNNADDLKATVKETWASIPPQAVPQTDHPSMSRQIEAVIKAKEPYQVLSTYTVNYILSRRLNNSQKMFFFYWSYEVSNLLRW